MQQHIVNLFYIWNMLYNIKRKKYKNSVCRIVICQSHLPQNANGHGFFLLEFVIFAKLAM
jgi:hypothetical protein